MNNMNNEVIKTTLSQSVFFLLRNYYDLIASLPEGSRRVAKTQAHRSASVLFGLSNTNKCNEITSLLDVDSKDLIVNILRLMRMNERSVYKLPQEKQKPAGDVAFTSFLKVFRALIRKLSAEVIKIVSLEGRAYDSKYHVEVINDGYKDDNDLKAPLLIEFYRASMAWRAHGSQNPPSEPAAAGRFCRFFALSGLFAAGGAHPSTWPP